MPSSSHSYTTLIFKEMRSMRSNTMSTINMGKMQGTGYLFTQVLRPNNIYSFGPFVQFEFREEQTLTK